MNRLVKLISVCWVLSSCQSAPEQESFEDESKTSTVQAAGGAQPTQLKKVKIPITVNYGTFGLLGTAATAYSVTLAGCLSGYSATVNQTNLDGIEVYKDDRTCLAKLTSLTTGGVTYTSTNPGATDFTTWAANNTAIFASAGGATIGVKVISQLSSPIAGTEAVTYNFTELLDGTSDYTFSEAQVSDPHLITVESQEAPHFTVKTATFTGMDDTTGVPEFTFKMECVDDPTAVTPTSVAMTGGSNTVCGTVDLADIEYKLVQDTYSSVLTISQADAIFTSGPGTTIAIGGDQYADSGTNEGFMITNFDGPGVLGTVANANMILILKAGISYTYFNIDVTTITQ